MVRLLVIFMDNNNRNFDYEPGVKRTYTPEEAGHERIRRPVSRQHRKRKKSINYGVVIIVVVFAMIVGVCVGVLWGGPSDGNGVLEGNKVPVTDKNGDAVVTTLAETQPPKELKITVTEKEMHMGDLILVNHAYPYAFADEEVNEIVKVFEHKNENYVVRDNTIQLRKSTIDIFNGMMKDMFEATGFGFLQVNSAYRSYEDQVSTYEYYKETNGEEYAKKYVANPGNSEHHTGLALDLNVNRNGAISYVESDEDCAWFRDHCTDYGFVLRYTPEKMYITGISGETWHYRYVGVPHAEIMTDMDLCLEEYTDYIKGFTQDTLVLYYNEGTMSKVEYDPEFEDGYMIYYVPSAGEKTVIEVPNFCEYKISGNNVDGYVVTAQK